jgi:phosphoribosylaminoimidazole-succinocarboxamide synthase
MTTTPPKPVFKSQLKGLELIQRGKVRDIYRVDSANLLIIASDRLSAFDVVLPNPIPGKGIVLTAISNFWFNRLRNIIPNHLTGIDPKNILIDPDDRAIAKDRSTIVQSLQPLPVEAVVRGYLIGSGWKDYCANRFVSGVELPQGLELADQLKEPIFTPSTKAKAGEHDQNITYSEIVSLIGAELAEKVKIISLRLYEQASYYARAHGIIIADTKFEFGLNEDGELILIDEIFTPDSSRFWPVERYKPGRSPDSFDKQYVRDYLETLDWDKKTPGPNLPDVVISRTSEKYYEVLNKLTT